MYICPDKVLKYRKLNSELPDSFFFSSFEHERLKSTIPHNKYKHMLHFSVLTVWIRVWFNVALM